MKKNSRCGYIKFCNYLFRFLIAVFFVLNISACGKSGGGGSKGELKTWYEDKDQDSYGNSDVSQESVSQPEGYVLNSGDCDDNNSDRYPNHSEKVDDGIDQDCQGGDTVSWYEDADGDGYGAPDGQIVTASEESEIEKFAKNSDDCNDNNPDINPAAIEDPGSWDNLNEIDENCDGKISVIWYEDKDNDGYGNKNVFMEADLEPAQDGYVPRDSDCDDENPEVNPGLVEITGDNEDNDCDGIIDEKGNIPDTGQTASITDGDDSSYLINEPSYTKLDSDGNELSDDALSWAMVKDNVTGLIWEIKQFKNDEINLDNPNDADNKYSLENIKTDFLDKLNASSFGGKNQWRIPTITEVQYLKGIESLNYMEIWNGMTSFEYLTSTISPINKDNVLTCKIGGLPSEKPVGQLLSAVAVFGATQSSSLTKNYNGTITDSSTGLMWQIQQDNSVVYNWTNAVKYCNSLEAAGYSDWRLPNKNELISLINYQIDKPPFFKDIFYGIFDELAKYSYWSSTIDESSYFFPPVGKYKSAYLVNFKDAAIEASNFTENNLVIAVRGNNLAQKTWYRDSDGDGYGDASNTLQRVEKPIGYVDNKDDFNDDDPGISPEATEIPDDGIDQDCTGFDLVTWYKDGDEDGYGTQASSVQSEIKPEGYVSGNNGFDCMDSNPEVHPGAEEVVDDDIDNDCDGNELKTWYIDVDMDTYGDPSVQIIAAVSPDGYVDNNNDCNDSVNTINPGALEVADDGIDQDCNGNDIHNWYADTDADGYGDNDKHIVADFSPSGYVNNNLDCNDSENDINPDAVEILDDSIDNDCNGIELQTWYVDYDKDNFGSESTDTKDSHGNTVAIVSEGYPPVADTISYVTINTDCNDDNSAINPGVVEVYGDSVDNNCNGVNDEPGIIPDTNQISSYTDIPGEDSDYTIAPQIFIKIDTAGNEVTGNDSYQDVPWAAVKDDVTNLTWEIKTPDNMVTTYSWDDALTYIQSLNSSNYAGYNDWRMPTLKELQLIADSDKHNPSINTDYFPNTMSEKYWTATIDSLDDNKAYAASFVYGQSYLEAKINTYYLRAVRGDADSNSDYVVNIDGTVVDTKTGLMWQQMTGNDGIGMTWEEALTYCENLELGGYDDWRLPSKNELQSLMNFTKKNPSINTDVFTDTNDWYWSSTYFAYDTEPAAWHVNFYDYISNISLESFLDVNFVRAVRGGDIQ